MLNKLTSSFSFLNGDSLRAKCARSSSILSIGTVADKGLAFVSKMILVRLLVPEEIGLMVLILSLTTMFDVFTEVGIKQSVIQHKAGAEPDYLNMAWWFQSVRSLCLYGAAYLTVPFVCDFYFADKTEVIQNHSFEELYLLVRTAFLFILLNGLVSPGAHILEKEFKFVKSVFIVQGSAIIGTAVTIILAYYYRNVWAMVIGFVSWAVFKLILSFVICPFVPKFKFDRESFKELLRFARGMLGIPILTYLAFNLDVLVAGKIVSADLLGMYGMAIVLARIPREFFTRIISPTLLPALAEKQDNREALRSAVLKLSKYIALFTFPFTALICTCSGDILSVVYNSEYRVIASAFSLLILYMILLLLGGVFINLFLALGVPAKHRLFVTIRTVILAATIYPCIKYFGLTGAAFSVFISNLIAWVFQIRVAGELIDLKINRYFLSLVPGLALSVPVYSIVTLLNYFVPSYVWIHFFSGLIFLIIVPAVVFVFKKGLLKNTV